MGVVVVLVLWISNLITFSIAKKKEDKNLKFELVKISSLKEAIKYLEGDTVEK